MVFPALLQKPRRGLTGETDIIVIAVAGLNVA
jgi:hypothetical protein